MVSGKITAVFENFDTSVPARAVVVEFEQKSFKDGKLVSHRWQLFTGSHKLKWAKSLLEKGFSVVVVVDDLFFFDERIIDVKDKFAGYGHVSEILTL